MTGTLTPPAGTRSSGSNKAPAALLAVVRMLDSSGLGPTDVDRRHLDALACRIAESPLRRNGRASALEMVNAWNKRLTEPNWPQVSWSVEHRKDGYSLGWDEFAPTFFPHAKSISAAHPAEDKEELLRDIRRFASALHLQTGCSARAVTCVNDLTTPAAFAAIMSYLRKRLQRRDPTARKSGGLYHSANRLIGLAKLCGGRTDDELKQLLKWNRQCDSRRESGGKRNRGMAAKNHQAVLEVVGDREKVKRLLKLSKLVLTRIKEKQKLSHADAARCAAAFAVGMLLVMPVGVKMATSIKLDNIIDVVEAERRVITIELPEASLELPPETHQLYDMYVGLVRPHLLQGGNKHLFPGRGGVTKNGAWFSMQIARLLSDFGIRLNVQQLRHVSAILWLHRNGGDFESIQRFLSIAERRSVLDLYEEFETLDAAAIADGIILQSR